MKAELDKLLEAKDQVLGLYERMEIECAQFVAKERNYEDRLNKMVEELDAKLTSELKLLDKLQP